ncbi:uncharacterized protein LOC6052267 isoform X1 [Culex quinquefasciatus]|uniref:uncharacterized protein LOC6052267 isoform X1 n=1 Tax=Culex quinquefasciatus TaxID=7176 RepID=UPI0018E3C410|nr:uncharacterized protein LOC6052267 isoform X1 [Culex quinquefasciatus]
MVGIGSRTCRGGRSWGLSSCANPLPLGGVQMVVRRKLQLRLLVVSMTAAPRVQSVSAIGPSANRYYSKSQLRDNHLSILPTRTLQTPSAFANRAQLSAAATHRNTYAGEMLVTHDATRTAYNLFKMCPSPQSVGILGQLDNFNPPKTDELAAAEVPKQKLGFGGVWGVAGEQTSCRWK